tara:strand:+ start:1993 stop:2409 length:417 start_codon:yes stop_codon:yes gene_type:complete
MKAILTGKCPQCREADMFCTQNPYKLKSLFLMTEHCRKCGLKFNREPGFFYGAMYVGYGLSVGYLIAFYIAMMVLTPDFMVETYFVFGIGSLLFLTPVIFKVSRSIWIHLFVRFDSSAVAKWEEASKGKEIDNPCIEV